MKAPALIVLGTLILLPQLAFAQGYRCVVQGRAYLSDRPCPTSPGTPSTPKGSFGQVGTPNDPWARGTSSYARTQTLRTRPAEEHLQFMSAECAAKSEAVRTAPARGVGHTTVQDLSRDFQRSCGEEDRMARQRASEQQATEREKQRSTLNAAAQANTQKKVQSERCFAMMDALQSRKKRLDPADARSRESLVAFEARYNDECIQL